MATNNIIQDPVFDSVSSTYKANPADLLYQLQQILIAVSGGGGGDATSANQLIQITQETAFNTNINAFKTANHADLVSLFNVLSALVTAQSSLTQDSNLTAFKNANHTDLLALSTLLTTLVTSTNAGALETTLSAFRTTNNTNLVNLFTDLEILINSSTVGGRVNLASLNSNLNAIYNGQQYLSTISGNSALNSDTNSVNSISCTISSNGQFGSYSMKASKFKLIINTNAGAVGTLDIEAKVGSSEYVRLMLVNMATGLNVLPPFTVAGKQVYELDVRGFDTIRITPSVLSNSYTYSSRMIAQQ